jgi:hypothetical protein
VSPRDAAELYRGFDRFSLRLEAGDDPAADLGDTWLSVVVEVRLGSRAWSDEDSCLTVSEVEGLADWLDGLGPDGPPSRRRFREGDLAFEHTPAELIVELDLELAPPDWRTPDAPFRFAVPFEPAQAREFAATLRARLREIGAGEEAEDSGRLVPPLSRRRPGPRA